jgi:5'-deoxynucleotidase YfbR-like HD superfamily hydrolase
MSGVNPYKGLPPFSAPPIANLEFWMDPQILLAQVMRFSKYYNDQTHGVIKQQNSLEHTFALCLLGSYILVNLNQQGCLFDGSLVRDALLIHDIGEAVLSHKKKADTHYIDKTATHDVEEHRAYMESIANLPKSMKAYYRKASLLQIGTNKKEALSLFEQEEQEIILWLHQHKSVEVALFELIERIDYLYLPFHQFGQTGNRFFLTQVLRNQFAHIESLSGRLAQVSRSCPV